MDYAGLARLPLRDEHIAQAPDGLDVQRAGRVGLDQLAQARDLHVQAAVEYFVFAATGQFHEFFARERLAAWRANTFSTENSPVVSGTVSPFFFSVRVPRSRMNWPNSNDCGVSDGAPGISSGPLRRSTAPMRATSSRGLNGLGK